ncbi:MAG: hypothetical protein LAO19_05070 [Acidobacteriia bacterium]|nr:hypothetical protein [Terriglobia bacterium]
MTRRRARCRYRNSIRDDWFYPPSKLREDPAPQKTGSGAVWSASFNAQLFSFVIQGTAVRPHTAMLAMATSAFLAAVGLAMAINLIFLRGTSHL